MGFKDLAKFNKAMLAKQVWRLLIDKTSLFYKVFSTKYFPSGSVFDANSSKGSYAWRSILKARLVVQEGMLWRIGNGSRVYVFYDKWILGVFPLKVATQNREFVDDSTVSSLINVETGEWNGQLIDQLMSPWLAQCIKAIPLCQTLQEDCIVWPRSKDENFLMKTGYQVLEEIERREATSGLHQATQRSFWKLNIPNKIRIFCWRACIDSLPMMKILYHRKVVAFPLCTACGKLEETTIRALWECKKIHISWGSKFNGL